MMEKTQPSCERKVTCERLLAQLKSSGALLQATMQVLLTADDTTGFGRSGAGQ